MEDRFTPRDKKLMLVAGGLFLAGCVALLIVIFIVRSEGFECINDPLLYGAALYHEKTGNQMYCSCTLYDEEGGSSPYSFSHEGLRLAQQEEQQ